MARFFIAKDRGGYVVAETATGRPVPGQTPYPTPEGAEMALRRGTEGSLEGFFDTRTGMVVSAALALLGGRELFLALNTRRANRRALFAAAKERSRLTGKPLIVVGSPTGGIVNRLVGRDYGCGSVCVDLVGCPTCKTAVEAPLETFLPKRGDNSAVIFVSAVLEYVDEVAPVIAELQRVSGGDLFVVTVEPWTLTSLFYPGAKRQFHSAPPKGDFRWQEFGR